MTQDPLALTLDAFADVMGEPAPHGPATTPDDVERWTSLTQVHLVYELESRAGTQLPEELLGGCDSIVVLVDAVRAATT